VSAHDVDAVSLLLRGLLLVLLLLQVSQYLEGYLWPHFDPVTSSDAHVLSIAVMVNEKFREGVPAWTAFHSRQVRASQSGLWCTGEKFAVMVIERFWEGVPAWTAFHSRQVRNSQLHEREQRIEVDPGFCSRLLALRVASKDRLITAGGYPLVTVLKFVFMQPCWSSSGICSRLLAIVFDQQTQLYHPTAVSANILAHVHPFVLLCNAAGGVPWLLQPAAGPCVLPASPVLILIYFQS
jgi:hypothetical protein